MRSDFVGEGSTPVVIDMFRRRSESRGVFQASKRSRYMFGLLFAGLFAFAHPSGLHEGGELGYDSSTGRVIRLGLCP